MPRETSILAQNAPQTVSLIDIPRTLELCQGLQFSKEKQLISSTPPQTPWTALPEPKSAKAISKLEPESIEDLLMRRHLEIALQNIRDMGARTWLLPRMIESLHQQEGPSDSFEGKASSLSRVGAIGPLEQCSSRDYDVITFHQNNTYTSQLMLSESSSPILIPPKSSFMNGFLENSIERFTAVAPKFNLVILDPPWPNRSARRKDSYFTTPHVSTLLSSLPLDAHLAGNALVGVWITNKASFRALVLEAGGLFDQWGLELEEEWVWLKITSSGEPIFSLGSRWRKPYEILLLGRRKTEAGICGHGNGDGDGDEIRSDTLNGPGVERRVIIAVPDLHSRKPNLKELLEPKLPVQYEALEIFARNLTEGWWAWGNEVCKFQTQDHWTKRHNEIPKVELPFVQTR